jgi:hypothetical protein
MEMLHRQRALLTRGDPTLLWQSLALGTVPVATRVISGMRVSARATDVEMTAQGDRTTACHGDECALLMCEQWMLADERLTMSSNDVADLDLRPLGTRRRAYGVDLYTRRSAAIRSNGL